MPKEVVQERYDRLIALHRDMLTNSQDSELLLAQGLGEIARAAARAR